MKSSREHIMNFEHYINLAKSQSCFTIDGSWAQGRSIFGGLSAALILSHIEAKTGLDDRDLRTMNVHFCGPINANEECDFSYQVLSSGKSIYQIQGQLSQQGQVKTQVMTCFGMQRPSKAIVESEKFKQEMPFKKAMKMPYIKGITPELVQKVDARLSSKNIPFSGSEISQTNGWMCFEDAPAIFSDAAILALIDAWPPAILPMLTKPAPASTITWNIEFIQPRAPLKTADYLYYECDVVQAQLGFAHTEGRVYHPDGELLALTRQLVGVYDKVD